MNPPPQTPRSDPTRDASREFSAPAPDAARPSPPHPEWLHAAWHQHRAWVPAVLLAHKPKWADLDDLLQDVALQVLRKGHQVHDPLAFPGWLRAVAINVARVAARRGPQAGWRGIRAALGFGAQDPSSENAPTPQSLELCEHARQILSLASQLDDDYREPLLLKAIEGLSYRQIGVVLGLPETTIETRITRARKQLRQLIVASDQSASRAPIVTEPTPARIPVGAKA